ncbi:MAG: hypothetical protein SGPRY_013144 [Prymnesium sp.]
MVGRLDFELSEGREQWGPVPEIVRLTFKSLYQVVSAQAEQIASLEKALAQRVSKAEHTAALAEKVNLSELTHTFEELSRVIDGKADAQEVHEALEKKVARSELGVALKLKADVSEVQRCLDEKANVDELQQAAESAEARSEQLQTSLKALIAAKPSAQEVHDSLSTMTSTERMEELVSSSLATLGAELRSEMGEALEKKAGKQSVSLALKVKAGREEVEAMVGELAAQLNGAISSKADVSAISAALREKISREEMAGALEAKLAELERRVERQLAEKPSGLDLSSQMGQLSAQLAEAERKQATLETASSRSRDDLSDAIKHLDRQFTAHTLEMRESLSLKASQSELEGRVRKGEVEGMLSALASKAEVEATHSSLYSRLSSELSRQASELRAQLDERLSTARAALSSLEVSLEGRVAHAELESAMRRCVTTRELEEALRGYATCEELSSSLKQRAKELACGLMGKCDVEEVHRLVDKVEASVGVSESGLKLLLGEVASTKAERTVVEKLQMQIDAKASVSEAKELSTRKANVEDVNHTLMEITRELSQAAAQRSPTLPTCLPSLASQRPTLSELNRVVGEQSLIMESLCSEHLLGRWIWKSGRTRGEKHAVPWNVQNINTNPENFVWTQVHAEESFKHLSPRHSQQGCHQFPSSPGKDSTSISCTAPGLYEVTFGFFTRKKPAVQLLINGEPVISAINSAS